ncbi:MAG: hypothetical protein AB1938_27470 [Myxococcota bacterium]
MQQRPGRRLQWGPCAGATTGARCRELLWNWKPLPGLEEWGLAARAAAHVRPDGGVTLAFGQLSEDGPWRVVAEADGEVDVAVRERPGGCVLGLPSLGEGRFAWRIYPRTARGGVDETAGAFLVGDIDSDAAGEGERFVGSGREGFATSAGWLEVDPRDWVLRRFDWTGGAPDTLADDGAAVSQPVAVRSTVFWQRNVGLRTIGLRVWTKDVGARDFLSFGDDWQRAAADLGTDGVDTVWVEASGRTSPDAPFRSAVLRHAPFGAPPSASTTLAEVSPLGLGTSRPVVGCGRVARLEAAGEALLLVDLRTHTRTTLTLPGGRFLSALAVTCSEVFALTSVGTNGGSSVPHLVRLESSP